MKLIMVPLRILQDGQRSRAIGTNVLKVSS